MNEARDQLLELKQAIREMPVLQRLEVESIAAGLRELMSRYGDCGQIALSLVAGEMALKEEEPGR